MLPTTDGALGRGRIVLDWETMVVAEKSREQVISELDLSLPKSFPNHAPTNTHRITWEVVPNRLVLLIPSVVAATRCWQDLTRSGSSSFGRVA